MARRTVSCVSRGYIPTCGFSPQPTEAHRFGFGGLQAALQAAPSLASCPQYAISDGRFTPRLPLQEVKSRSHRSLEHNLRNGARRMPASKVKHCNLRGRGASRGRCRKAPGRCSNDSKHDSTSHCRASYRHGLRGTTHYWDRWDWFAMRLCNHHTNHYTIRTRCHSYRRCPTRWVPWWLRGGSCCYCYHHTKPRC